MPVDFKCSTCQCRFSLGGYHYHDFSSGYAGETLAVCRSAPGSHRTTALSLLKAHRKLKRMELAGSGAP